MPLIRDEIMLVRIIKRENNVTNHTVVEKIQTAYAGESLSYVAHFSPTLADS